MDTKKKVRVLTVLSSPNLIGGTPAKIYSLIKESKCQHFIYFYSKGCNSENYNDYLKEFKKYSSCFEGHINGRNIFKHIKEIIKIVDYNSIDIIQTCFFFGELVSGIVKFLRPKVKLIVSFENSFIWNNYKKIIENVIFHQVDHFICISNYVQGKQIKSFPILKKKNCCVIYNGSNLKFEDSFYEDKILEFSILYVGGMIECKNHDLLIEAADIIKNKYLVNNVYIHFLGDGPLRKRLEKKTKNLKLKKNVIFWGYRNNVGSALKKCQLYVHPCIGEGFGLAVTEAMLAGKAIIVADSGALPELIKDGETGYILPANSPKKWADKIIELRENQGLIKTIGANAAHIAKNKFSADKYIFAMDDIYMKIVSPRKSN